MQEAGDSNIDVKVEIQSELISINAIVTKIKQELHEINNIVQSNGSLDIALENAIDSLVSLAQATGVTIENPTVTTPGESTMANTLSRITARYITEKLQKLTHE